MATYRPRSDTRVEAKQWCNCEADRAADTLALQANNIVAWVNANGGEARYEQAYDWTSDEDRSQIAVRTINGWAYAAPGHYVVMGSETYHDGSWGGCRHCGSTNPDEDPDCLRDFYPCDPATFESRWEFDA